MALDNLRILRLEAENIKKLVVVEITPKGELVQISGKNGQGKTSVLDCILWAMGGERPIQWKPIREGEEKAKIVLDLGDDDGLKLQVTRRFTAQDDGTFTTSLKLTNEDGYQIKGEQGLLNAITGALSFDPAAFMRAKPPEQVAILRQMIPDADFDGIAKRRQTAFDERTDFNRDAKRLRAQAESIVVEEGLPAEPIDVADYMGQLQNAARVAGELAREASDRQNRRDHIQREAHRLESINREIEELEKRLADARERKETLAAWIDTADAEMDALTPLAEPPNTDEIRAKLDEAQATNAKIAKATERAGLLAEAEKAEAESAKRTAAIEEADREVIDLIESADLPVRGLSLSADRVMLRGVPFEQASDAEQLRASMAIGMASNPKLRVMRIRNGNDFDEDALKVIAEVAHADGFQIWMERVVADGPEAIIMENGQVKGA